MWAENPPLVVLDGVQPCQFSPWVCSLLIRLGGCSQPTTPSDSFSSHPSIFQPWGFVRAPPCAEKAHCRAEIWVTAIKMPWCRGMKLLPENPPRWVYEGPRAPACSNSIFIICCSFHIWSAFISQDGESEYVFSPGSSSHSFFEFIQSPETLKIWKKGGPPYWLLVIWPPSQHQSPGGTAWQEAWRPCMLTSPLEDTHTRTQSTVFWNV